MTRVAESGGAASRQAPDRAADPPAERRAARWLRAELFRQAAELRLTWRRVLSLPPAAMATLHADGYRVRQTDNSYGITISLLTIGGR
jgi:hypothetical protein